MKNQYTQATQTQLESSHQSKMNHVQTTNEQKLLKISNTTSFQSRDSSTSRMKSQKFIKQDQTNKINSRRSTKKTLIYARGVMVIYIGNGHGDTNSNPGRG